MLFSGINTNAQRPGSRGQMEWRALDITELSTEEFSHFWKSIETDADRFYVAEMLRRMALQASDVPSEEGGI